jgi:alkylation response protein AidB-like acyl-CoA dehydrogenase
MDATMTRGCAWLLGDDAPAPALVPEALGEEHRLIARTAEEFVLQEVLPALPDLERKRWDVARALVARAGALGLIAADVPEALGGVGLDKAASVVIGDAIGACPSFATTFGAQSGLAIIPLLCFGTPEQQQRYLPRIASGEILGAYCLSETGSGSDALGARARATRLEDGSWSLTGEKMWISNGGFADLFVVFAKVDGEQFSAFLVERGFPGVSTGAEEHKMGLHGSSTTPLVLQEARVPAANLLGEIGAGHKIAFNVLNYGRFKLGAMCSGGARAALLEAIRYAAGRRQFGRPIASFGAIRHKIAEMTIRVYAVESMLYRTAGMIDAALPEGADGRAIAAALEEFAVEASLLKIASSEAIDYVVDENVQIHGGNGFVADYPAERRYRDARVNRIFEGTNEINRLVVPAQILKRGRAGRLPLADAAARAESEMRGDPRAGSGASIAVVQRMKATAVWLLGRAVRRHGEALDQEQEVLMLIADVVTDAFAAESAMLRAGAARRAGHRSAALHADAADVFVHDAARRADTAAAIALAALDEDGDPAAAGRPATLVAAPRVDTIAARRRIAEAALAGSRYIFSITS